MCFSANFDAILMKFYQVIQRDQWKGQFRKDFTKIGQLLTIFEKRDDSIANFDIDIGLTSKSNLFQKVILDSFG